MTEKGFTLIEILVALLIFAILASITASSMYYAFETRQQITQQANEINAVALTTALLKQDTVQALSRKSTGAEMHIFPAFVGETNYFEFTRDGIQNPDAMAAQSSLARVAYVCKGSQLIRRSWARTDSPVRHHYEDRILLEHLSQCAFAYVTANRLMVPQWQDDPYTKHQISMPIAVQVILAWTSFGEMSLLFTFPEALYDAKIAR